MEREKILVNCALPYANGPLHLGHIAGAYLGADIFVRFNRMSGNEVLFISGSDEYGTPITISAEKNHVPPQEIADKYHIEQINSFNSMDIIFDKFTRTSDPEHVKDVDEFFINLLEKGYLVKRYMISPFCVEINKFMPDRYIEGECPYCGYKEARGDQCDNCGQTLDPIELINPICKMTGNSPIFRVTDHFFLKLDSLQEKLAEFIDSKTYWRPNVLKFTQNFIGEGLHPRAITRDLDWGVKIPLKGYENKKIYVWFEALIGYITGARVYSEETGKPDYWKEFWMDKNIKSYYFIGKDNIPFHTIIWPAMLLAHGGFNLPYNVPANEYLRFEGEKFSKSRGIGFTVDEMLKFVDKNSLRYYMSSVLPETGDSDFSMNEFQLKVNSELIDKYGNYIYRVESFIEKNGLSPHEPETMDAKDREMMKFLEDKFSEYSMEVSGIHIKRGISIWLEIVMAANNYFTESAPWKLIKEDMEKLNEKLYVSLKIGQYLTAMLYPYVPSAAESIWQTFGISENLENATFNDVLKINKFNIKKGSIPFEKIDFSNPDILDIQLATIVSVEDHPGADSLYSIKLHGDKIYQTVSDLKKYYTKSDLQGKQVLILTNIEKARIRGVESQCLILSIWNGNSKEVISSTGNDGDFATLGKYRYNGEETLTFKEFQKMEFTVSDHHIIAKLQEESLPVMLNGKDVNVSIENLDKASIA
ncbi:methionyl-tRNA synthetase [Ferroplasma acidiphilum]|uniref:Methionine--tRNA ligase n=1 Tax=Ferroplasma acidiphilum TaxID=74969 RepID=A0A1V0N645_9ARCH|nr:methionine--tRNA ligase [Ferroplasma acidiphilum]ARD85603.1 methionyl-tRNA synthetase [Ferroplasma acidiphilum]